MKNKHLKILLSAPRGFCAGVDRAIEIVEKSIKKYGAPVYVRHEIVHNKYVVDGLRDKGAVFVDELDEVPDDSTVIFSAHGVAKAVKEEADRRQLRVFDAICPLVTKVHMEVARLSQNVLCHFLNFGAVTPIAEPAIVKELYFPFNFFFFK